MCIHTHPGPILGLVWAAVWHAEPDVRYWLTKGMSAGPGILPHKKACGLIMGDLSTFDIQI